MGKSIGGRSSLLIVTANQDPAWTESLLSLTRRGILPAVFLFDVNTFGRTAKIGQISNILQSFNIPCHIIPKELLDKPQARPGHEGEWDWRITGTGKAVAVQKPVTDWRGLE